MRLLFMPYPSQSGTWGSTVYLLAIAREARRRGHEVIFQACAPAARLLSDNGFPVYDFVGASGPGASGAVDDIYDVLTALGMDDAAYWQYLLDQERTVIEEVGPDVIVADMRPTAAVSARRSGVPLVNLASFGTDPRTQRRPAGHPLDDIARDAAREYFGDAVDSLCDLLFWNADRKIATSFPEFEPELRDVPGLSYIGYLDGTNRRGLDGLPPRPERLVLAYLSTVGWHSATMVRSLARSAELAGVQVWCVTNANGRMEQVSDHLWLADYLPLDELLPEAKGLLFHGGQGTALAALFHAVPSIACPGQNYERRYNADRVEALGCGVHASTLDLRPSALSGLLARIADDPAMRESARAAQAVLRTMPGPAGAVDVLDDLRQASVAG
ncbi:glycosyl transferase [Actinoplanes cyaneus]|uniref:Glycosyl transferase n=1 Tax=Actinoplanes cyaneus TaxID=52696 RepID=A0A919ITJ2_9ACTN|nr:nucleotide disphospho-sugar-binding domain-containing protein [Actinoplanes cyaneus]MCW2144276.1 UDP:flavonoid glycosyltransferase YjiC, YdhE family [Actinoplanes cyaneus]GID71011.1 glycosyl transferase [Actinoplanes cyaneus]